jgi:anaerobic dimethyl sulfoxide reductase subunit B (iron-sulfur subunit)
MPQYGFYFDQSRCTGCNACVVACKQWNNIPPGPVKWMRVYQWEKGAFPNIALRTLAIPCYHCEKPVCLRACPNHAIYKDDKYGAVLIDSDKCKGTRKCWLACPYGAPQYENDELGTTASKCTMCVDRLEQGLKPICVLSCSLRALEFGPIDELMSKCGALRELEDMPSGTITKPAAVFKPRDPKKQIVACDAHQLLELWRKRDTCLSNSLPDVFEEPNITELPTSFVGRNKLVLKAKDHVELMYYTTDDE